MGFEDNFAWYDLDLDGGAEIDLAGGLSGVLDVAYYTHILEGALFSPDDSTITNIIGNGFNIYYDPFAAENAYLRDKTFELAGTAGGFLTPVPAPEPASLPLVLSGLGMLVWARRRERGAKA